MLHVALCACIQACVHLYEHVCMYTRSLRLCADHSVKHDQLMHHVTCRGVPSGQVQGPRHQVRVQVTNPEPHARTYVPTLSCKTPAWPRVDASVLFFGRKCRVVCRIWYRFRAIPARKALVSLTILAHRREQPGAKGSLETRPSIQNSHLESQRLH